MTPAEVEAVLELWREVEGTRPGGFFVARSGTVPAILSPSGLRADQAYDALCGHLRRWLEARPGIVAVTEDSIPAHSVPERRYGAGYIRPGASMVMHHDSTRLLALIAAVLAVTGTTGKTQTQGGQDGGPA